MKQCTVTSIILIFTALLYLVNQRIEIIIDVSIVWLMLVSGKKRVFSVSGFSIIIRIVDLTINIYYKNTGNFTSIVGKIEKKRSFEMKHKIITQFDVCLFYLIRLILNFQVLK